MSQPSSGNPSQSESAPLLVRLDTPKPQEFLVEAGKTQMGRSPDCEICIAETSVSRNHCYLERAGDDVRVFDVGSRNHTRVNGEIASGQLLRPGDRIRIGRCEFEYRHPAAEAQAEASLSSPARAEARPSPRRREPAPRSRQRGAPRRAPAARSGWQARGHSSGPVYALVAVFTIVGVLGGYVISLKSGSSSSGVEPGDSGVPSARTLQREDDTPVEVFRQDDEIRSLNDRLAQLEDLLKQSSKESSDSAREEILAELGRLRARLGEVTEERDRLLRERRRGAGRSTETNVDSSTKPPEKTLHTEVVKVTPVVRDPALLVARLTEIFEDYASITVSASTLSPPLEELCAITGRPGAEGVVAVYRHARGLLEELDKNLKYLDSQIAGSLKKAERKGGENEATGYGRRRNPATESKQRYLELFRKKKEIKTKQRKKFLRMRAKLTDAFRCFIEPDARKYLANQIVSSAIGKKIDAVLNSAILNAIRGSKDRALVPILLRKMDTRNVALREMIRQTLAAITGTDQGEKYSAWKDWWLAQKE